MFEIHNQDNKLFVEIIIDGVMTRTEFDKAYAAASRVFDKQPDAAVLAIVRDMGGTSPILFWNAVKKLVSHVGPSANVAFVIDHHWVRWLTMSAKVMAPCEVAYFRLEDEDDARQWLAERSSQSSASAA